MAIREAAETDELAAALTTEGLSPAPHPAPRVVGDDADRLLTALDALRIQKDEYERCAEAAASRERDAEARIEQLRTATNRAQADLDAAAESRAEAERLRERLADQTAELDAREAQMRQRDQAAESRLAEREAAARTELALTLEAERAQLADLRAADLAEIDEVRRERLADVDQERGRLARTRKELDELRSELEFERGRQLGEDIRLSRLSTDLEAEIQARATDEIGALERDLHVIRIEAESRARVIEDLDAKLAEQATVLLKIGSSDPAHLLEQLDRLQTDNRELRDKLAERLQDDDLTRLRRLEQQNRGLVAERDKLKYELEEARGHALANRINNLQMKQLDDAERHFEVLRRGYETRIAELRTAIEELYRDRPDPGTPLFPRCVAMDDDPRLSEPIGVSPTPIDLSTLASSLQGFMHAQGKRAYRLNDVCLVLGGLAMSNLHLLEGMSGIGKTSLPKALAAALGTECAVVEVQAGWRDRTDLFGHHNTFERRFEESEFLQALYLAQTPLYRDRPFFIVLDEMNLSRPEQYFSVVLSKLENNDGEPIQLVSQGSGRAPEHLVDGARIALPDNVWFVGTANQDESTLEFADKTYNRAFLMELPTRHPQLPRMAAPDIPQYGTRALRRAFHAAATSHQADTKAVVDFVSGLAEDLYEHGRAVMGARLEKQLRSFVPVVAAAKAGTVPGGRTDHIYGDEGQDGRALAADHFLAMKLLRSIRGRYDVTPDGIEKLSDAVLAGWDLHNMNGTPVRSTRLLEEEKRRRES
ncbi:AAA family ATPase [Lentzea sp. HUAS12]|uniref:AAA family ATPase n=1 Tax=Lentzea sp. HUAS12 TaxID=2951806 RepID=UPI00209CE26E|nr:AAA family ATPase [Lentzea sp. HUAS12]USX56241.1 AAA family ATPase [Lentzea sp. HUAS12]